MNDWTDDLKDMLGMSVSHVSLHDVREVFNDCGVSNDNWTFYRVDNKTVDIYVDSLYINGKKRKPGGVSNSGSRIDNIVNPLTRDISKPIRIQLFPANERKRMKSLEVIVNSFKDSSDSAKHAFFLVYFDIPKDLHIGWMIATFEDGAL
jgi:hypothetical protein